MDLYVCYDFFKNIKTSPRPGGHPCGVAHVALKEAGHQPTVHAVHGLGFPPFNGTAGRKKVQEISGQTYVPVLVTDDGETITGSKEIAAWAQAHSA